MEQVWEIRWTNTAANEFEATIDWLLYKFNEKVAASFRDDVWRKIERLSKAPFIGKSSPHLENCRQTIVPPYHLIIYTIFDSHIDVLRVFDGRQSLLKLR
jgi:plasmid stabilization system protein ParE